MTNILWEDYWKSNNGSKIRLKGDGSDAKTYWFEVDLQCSDDCDDTVVFEFALYKEEQVIYLTTMDSFVMEDAIETIKDLLEIDLSDKHINLFEYLDLIKGD